MIIFTLISNSWHDTNITQLLIVTQKQEQLSIMKRLDTKMSNSTQAVMKMKAVSKHYHELMK